MFVTERANFGRPLPALRSVAEPVASIRWQIFFTVLSFQFSGVFGRYRLCSVTLLTQRLHSHFVGQRLTHISSVLKRVLYKNYQNSVTKN